MVFCEPVYEEWNCGGVFEGEGWGEGERWVSLLYSSLFFFPSRY